MGDDIADAAQILLTAGVHIVQRCLEDSRGEGDVVGGGVIAGIHRVGGHDPFPLVRRVVLVGQCLGLGGLLDGDHVGEEGAALLGGLDLHAVQIGVPAVGVAHLDAHVVQLLHGPGLGLGAHPILGQDALLIDGDELADHLLYIGLGRGGEVLVHIGLAEVVGQQALHLLGRDLLAALAGVYAVVAQSKVDGGIQGPLAQRPAYALHQSQKRRGL